MNDKIEDALFNVILFSLGVIEKLDDIPCYKFDMVSEIGRLKGVVKVMFEEVE